MFNEVMKKIVQKEIPTELPFGQADQSPPEQQLALTRTRGALTNTVIIVLAKTSALVETLALATLPVRFSHRSMLLSSPQRLLPFGQCRHGTFGGNIEC